MKKQAIVIMTLMLLAALVFTGCGSSGETADQATESAAETVAQTEPSTEAQAEESTEKATTSKPVETKATSVAATKKATTTAAKKQTTKKKETTKAKKETTKENKKATARKYVGKSVSSLISAIGSPKSRTYADSCLGSGQDGQLKYDGFTVYTYKEGNKETVQSVE